MLSLGRYRRHMSVTSRCLFLSCWARLDPAVATVVAHAIDGRVLHRSVVNVVDVGDVYIRHRAVIEEVSIVPASSRKADAEVTEPIIDSAIKTHLRTPIAFVEDKCTTAPAPPPRRPQEADLWCHNPGAGHPVVIGDIVIPIPVTWSPDITIAGTNRLLINRQRWRPDRDRYSELRQSAR